MTTQAEISRIAREVARCTVEETFGALGVDISDQPARIEVQKDFAFLRGRRILELRVRTRAFITMTIIITGAIVAAVWATIIGQKNL